MSGLFAGKAPDRSCGAARKLEAGASLGARGAQLGIVDIAKALDHILKLSGDCA